MAMNWSFFKPEFLGKQDEDPEAHVLRMIYWMYTHSFATGQRVQTFLLMQAGKARLWYQSIHTFQGTWKELWERFRMQFSKIGNTWGTFFHAYRTFDFDVNAATIDAYVHRIRQVSTVLNHDEPQALKVFQNTLPLYLYRVLFPIDNLRQAVEMAMRILHKEKLDRQLTGQSMGAPFLKMKGERQHKTVVFNESSGLDSMIERLTSMLGKLSAQNRQMKFFKLRVYQCRGKPLINSGKAVQHYDRNNHKRSYDRCRLYDKITLQ